MFVPDRGDPQMALSDASIRAAKAAEAQYKLYDEGGLFLIVRTSGGKLWRLSENTLNTALRRLGYGADEMTSHGFRSTASTLLNESGKWSVDAIERALADGVAKAL